MSGSATEKDEPEWLEKDLFDDMCDGLVEFKQHHGHLDVPMDYQYHDEYLAIWLDKQRKMERLPSKRRRLPQDKIDRLVGIGIDFEHGNAISQQVTAADPVVVAAANTAAAVAAPVKKEKEPVKEQEEEEELDEDDEVQWNFMYKGLCVLKETLGHVDVPKGCEYFGVSLYDFAKEQRERYKDQRKRHTWRKKIDLLQNLGFELCPEEKRKGGIPGAVTGKQHAENNKLWSLMLEGLKEFKKLSGGLDVPPGCEYHGYSLYDWLRKQKQRYANTLVGEKPDMSEDRMRRLSAVGVGEENVSVEQPLVRQTDDSDWEDYFQALVDFKADHGHLDLPPGYNSNGRNLCSWVDGQRRVLCARRTKLTRIQQSRLDRLAELGIPHLSMSLQEARWQIMYEAATEFKKRHGHFKVPGTCIVDGRYLNKWLAKMRSYYQNRVEGKKLPLSDERLERLQAIGFDLEPAWTRLADTEARKTSNSFDDHSEDETANSNAPKPSPKKQKLSP